MFGAPLTQTFFDHWRGLRRGTNLPTTEEYFDRIEPRLAPMVVVFECFDHDVIVRYQGSAVVERWRADRTGQSWIAPRPEGARKTVLTNMLYCVRLPCGVWAQSTSIARSGRAARQENLTLPLAVKSGRVSRLVLFTTMLEPHKDRDDVHDHTDKQKRDWFDVGFGTPLQPMCAQI